MPAVHARSPLGLGRLGMAVLLIFVLIGSALLMHTLAGPAEGCPPSMAGHHTETESAHTAYAEAAPVASSAMQDDCTMLCAIMGMACLVVLVLFAWSATWRRQTRALFTLSKTLNTRPIAPSFTLPRLTPDLTQLNILRI